MRKLLIGGLLFLTPIARADLISGTIGSLAGSSGGLTTAYFLVSPSTGITAGTLASNINLGYQVSLATGVTGSLATAQFTGISNVTANHTITSTETIVGVTGTATVSPTITLPSATGSGRILMIYKADTTTAPITINGAGTDVIEGTGTLKLNAYTQADQMQDVASGLWVGWGKGIEITPSILGLAQDGSSSAAPTASSDTVICPFFVDVPVAVTGFRTFSVTCTGASLGFVNFAVYDSTGNLRASSSTVICPGAAAMAPTLTAPVNLSPGQYYYGAQINNATLAIGSTGANGGNGSTICSRMTSTTGTLPNPFVFGTTSLKVPAIFVNVAGGKSGI